MTTAVALREGERGGPGLGPRALLDQHELAAGVVDAGAVEADHDLEGEHQLAVEVAVQGVPVAGAVAQQQGRGPGLAGGVAGVEPVAQRVGPGRGLARRSAHSRAIGSRCGQNAARSSATTAGSGWAK